MSTHLSNETERQLRTLFEGVAPAQPAGDLFGAVMARTADVRQRPAWRTRSGLGPRSARLRWAVAVTVGALALAAFVAGLLLTAGVLPRPRTMPEVELLYVRSGLDGGGLFAMRADGSDNHRLFEREYPGQVMYADWSPDGEQVVFVDNDTRQLVVSRLDAPEEAWSVDECGPLREGGRACRSPSWSPDGSRVAFIRSEGEPSPSDVVVLDVDSGEVTQVLRLEHPLRANYPGWSPDGTQLVISVEHWDAEEGIETGVAIATVPAVGGELRYLTTADRGFAGADWSPLGDRLVFAELGMGTMADDSPDTVMDLWTMDPDGGNLERLTDAAPGTRLDNPSWSPDGSWIIARAYPQGIAVRVDPNTGSVTPIGGTEVFKPLVRP